MSIFNHLDIIVPSKASEFSELTRNKCYYAVQGHSRSPILVPIESPCAILVINSTITYILSRTV